MRRTAALCFFASILLSGSALASGYGLRDVSAATLGLSYAGDAANGSRASTLAFNPALAADVGEFDVAISNVGLLPKTDGTFTATTAAGTPVAGITNPKDIVNTALIPAMALRYRLTPTIAVGFTATAPWGMITDYGNTGVTRYYATMSDVKSANFSPVVSWQVLPELSIGGGLQVQYIKGRLAKAIDFGTLGYVNKIPGSVPGARDGFVELRAQDWATGWTIGAEWKPTPNFSVGVSYKSKIENTLNGNEWFTLDSTGIGATLKAVTGAFVNGPASAPFSNPDLVTFGARWKLDPQWTISVGGDWTGWSAFNTLTAHSHNPKQPDDVTVMNWQDSWFGSVGVEYKPSQLWTLRLGTAYDQTPTTSGYRTPGIPDGGRYWISGGIGYQLTQHIDLDLSVAHLIAEKGNIALKASDPGNAARGSLTGSVNMEVTLIGAEFSYHL
ncbi:long-chain fatty acid transport protein [Rhizomicrobium palustre]|uniref:Long-chain fatty acid transport protein n=1 Tax=Rhizomicrobium palustre TaxID=189966 RepID=A0A846MZR9_9PROT|nr:outer membrane protein transport protein [Rhizomicrobium palustre]NIK89164.1 long-chain fatty acid transport protein [Rhizomicrobium palustre]